MDSKKVPYAGVFANKLDAKNRLVFPAKHYDLQTHRNHFVRDLLYISLAQMPPSKDEIKPYLKLVDATTFMERALTEDCRKWESVSIDQQKRIVLPEPLIKAARLENLVVISPATDGNSLELWNALYYDAAFGTHFAGNGK